MAVFLYRTDDKGMLALCFAAVLTAIKMSRSSRFEQFRKIYRAIAVFRLGAYGSRWGYGVVP